MENKNTNPLQKYFRQPKIYLSLPSNGKYYPTGSLEISENGEYPVFPMTARDEIMIKTPDALLNGQATASVITSCIPAIKDPFNMPSMDLDACLIAIRIATYGEMMEVSIKVPVTGEDKDFDLDLRIMLDQFSNVDYNSAIQLDGMIVNLRPLTYGEFTETSRKTFDEQRIFNVINDSDISKFQVKPLVVDATPEEIEAGVPETYEVPVTFDQSSFFV